MNRIYAMLIGLYLCQCNIAQTTQQKIYRTVQDYLLKQSSIPIDSLSGKKVVQASNFLLSPYLFYRSNDVKQKVLMDSIYAFTDNKGCTYRVWNRDCWLVCNSAESRIYSKTTYQRIKIRSSRGFTPRTILKTDYYFSPDDTSSIFPLSRANLQQVYGSNNDLTERLLREYPEKKS